MAFSFNSPDKSFEFTIRDFSPDAQRLLMSCLDVNGLMADPDAFKLVLFQHIQELVKDPAELELAKQIALKGQIEPLLKDESNFLNFTLNSFRMTLSNIGREASDLIYTIGREEAYVTYFHGPEKQETPKKLG